MTGKGVKVVVTSGRTLGQGRAMEKGKTSPEYMDAVAVCELDSTAFQELGINDGDPVVVKSQTGKITVRSKLSKELQPGMAFIPCGPYFNTLIVAYTQQTGMPGFKAIQATVSPAPNARIRSIEEIAKRRTEVPK